MEWWNDCFFNFLWISSLSIVKRKNNSLRYSQNTSFRSN
jgi:hypothetical protein